MWHPSKGPATSPKLEKPGTGKRKITQVRSAIGHSWRMRATLAALGLRNHQASVVQQDSASLRGQLKKVRHLVQVTPVEE
ncbi:MAG: 50S ribosomal protein L30 [Gemmatimonadaceae bacterium]|nr:50S ribosomal protein L30 [Gemmatimonadaceae bacterium]